MAQEYIDVSTDSAYHYTSSYSKPGGGNTRVNHASIHHLYYSNYNTGSGIVSESGYFDNYIESSFVSASRYLGEMGIVYSVPRELFGTHIAPGSVVLSSGSYRCHDDGEGNLLDSSDNNVGNVIYTHGQIIVTDNTFATEFSSSMGQPLAFSSTLPVHTHHFTVRLSDYEFNHTLNPTAQSGSTTYEYSGSFYSRPSGIYANNVTGSDFQPYITTVGLYNDANELIAVGKLAQPVPKPADTELVIKVQFDV